MLKEQLQQALTAALKAGESTKRLVLGMVITGIKNRELAKRTQLSKTITDTAQLEKNSQLTEAEVVEALAAEAKKRREAIEQFTAGGRMDLADKEKIELAIIQQYLPAQLSEAEIRAEVQKAIAETGITDVKEMGKVLGPLMARLKGKADGTTVSQLVREALSA